MTPLEKVVDFLGGVKRPFQADRREVAQKLLNTVTWQPRQGLSEEEVHKKMVNNSRRAQATTLQKHPQDKAYLATLEELNAFLKPEKLEKPLIVTKMECTKKATHPQKIHSENEDVTFFQKEGDYTLAGLCDGHGGKEVADFLKERFEEQFFDELKENKTPFEAFEMFIREAEGQIYQKMKLAGQGTTLVVCLINSKTGEMITATVGDSAATTVVQIGKETKVIRNNVERDWTTPKEALRPAFIHNDPGIVSLWPTLEHPDRIRFPVNGLNLSRSIGDLFLKSVHTTKIGEQTVYGISSKPTLSVSYLKPGSRVVICSDGVDKVVGAKEMIDQLKDRNKDSALELVTYAQSTKGSQDDVTALVLDVE